MPTASIDFTMATMAIIMVVAGAIYGVNMVAIPYLNGKDHNEDRYYQLGRSILLSKGEPDNWGTGATPTKLGLAQDGSPYKLDIDKVTRLNPENFYAVNYSTLWNAFKVDDVSVRFSFETVFDVEIVQTGSTDNGDNTSYTFSLSCLDDGYPLATSVAYYTAIRDSVYTSSGTTGTDGTGTVEFTIPDSKAGTGVIVVVAKLSEGFLSYDVLTFGHKSGVPADPGTYATLSPLDDVLSVDLTSESSVLNAIVFTYGHYLNLTSSGDDIIIPEMVELSPMILAVTGVNGTDYWAEWMAYPQIPLEVGADMDADYVVSDVTKCSYLVEVGGVFYRFELKARSPEEYD